MQTWPHSLGLLYRYLVSDLRESGIETAEQDARWMIERRTPYRWADLIAHPESLLTPAQIESLSADLHQRLRGMPLSRLYGVREFRGLPFHLSPATLDPRPETESLVERALKAYGADPPPLFADLGTGTGCIAIALLKEWPRARAILLDRSFEALQTARRNAVLHGVVARIHLVCGDWAESLAGPLPLIVSNPPYIDRAALPNLPAAVQNHDPILALDGGEEGLEPYKKIFSQAKFLLLPHGKIFLEIGFDQAEKIERLVEVSRVGACLITPDLAGQPRVAEITCGDK